MRPPAAILTTAGQTSPSKDLKVTGIGRVASAKIYGYSVYQAEYSRNLLFASGAQMHVLFDRIVDRTRSRLDIPQVRTLFGLKTRPHRNRAGGPPAQDIVIEKPQYGLSWFRASGCCS